MPLPEAQNGNSGEGGNQPNSSGEGSNEPGVNVDYDRSGTCHDLHETHHVQALFVELMVHEELYNAT